MYEQLLRRVGISYSPDFEEKGMLIHNKIASSSVNGPGNRAVIWMQGCSLACKGCWNPETHSFNIKNDVSIGEIQTWLSGLKDIEGVTFSGGEPMQQAPYLYVLVAWIRQNLPNLSIGLFTGYSKRELENGNFKWKSAYDADWVRGSQKLWGEIKAHLDFAVVGRYVESMACHDEPMRGSRNQEVLFFTAKYKESDLQPQAAEVTVDENGLIQITGFPTVAFLDSLKANKPMISSKSIAVPVGGDDDNGDLVGA